MFACLAYFLEVEDKTQGIYTFASVFDALYWGLLTLTTCNLASFWRAKITVIKQIESNASNHGDQLNNVRKLKIVLETNGISHSGPPGTITISTVGYGDIAPVTKEGKFIGAALALLGLPLIAIPMPLIMSKFDSYYQVREA